MCHIVRVGASVSVQFIMLVHESEKSYQAVKMLSRFGNQRPISGTLPSWLAKNKESILPLFWCTK